MNIRCPACTALLGTGNEQDAQRLAVAHSPWCSASEEQRMRAFEDIKHQIRARGY